jgi:predicted RNA-binding protein with PIN domain
MILLIDAYNVLKQVLLTINISQAMRTRFVDDLNKYAKIKGHQAVIVFDAGPTQWPYREQRQNACVVYSGTRMSADDYIKRYIEEHKEYDVLLISSDRELCAWVMHKGVESLKAGEFYDIVQQAIKDNTNKSIHQQSNVLKITTDASPELDELMLDASCHVPVKQEQAIELRKSPSSRISKKERKVVKKIKRL